ncbi:glycosyltransferase [Bacillus cereus]|nr:glycosyltransferase [Bacillus cereus]PGM62781.1 glycosyltransferase [Bacillus cereus]
MIGGKRLKETTITLCMIVKNEEYTLERCLNSVKNLVDEIIIVDTGSDDRTISICKMYTQNIYHFKWIFDFSAARNFSISLARGTWILWLDADEKLSQTNFKELKHILATTENNLFLIPILNYVGNQINKNNVYQIFQPRIFRKDAEFKFHNKIHETLNVPLDKYSYGILDAQIKHYGYLESHVKKKKKYQRNLEILKEEAENSNNNPWINYHMSSEYYNLQNHKAALDYINSAILKFISMGIVPPSMAYRLKYTIILELNDIDNNWSNIDYAIFLYPDYVDLYFLKASLLFRVQKYQDAINCLKNCLQLGEDNPKYLILKGTGSFRAKNLWKRCLKKLKK